MTSSRFIVRHDVITITKWSLRFWELQFPFSCSVCITILCQFRHDFVPISCSACITNSHEIGNCSSHFRVRPQSHFRPCPDLPKFDVTKVMDHNQSYSKCHLQPYKHFLQVTCNCGTPLIHISHAQNGYIKSGLLRQSFEFFCITG